MIVDLVNFLKERMDFEFYPGVASESAKLPCGVYTIVNESERIGVNFGSFQTDYAVQIDIYTDTYKEANLLKERLKEALFSFYRPITSLSANIDKDDENYRVMVEFESFV